MAKSKILMPNEILIDENTDNDLLFSPNIDGRRMGMGMTPPTRVEYRAFGAPPSDMQLIPRSEWSERIKDKVKYMMQLSDILLRGDNGKPIPSTDQNGHGYCWGYSTGGCVQAVRACQGMPYVRLNPHAVCAVIKGGRDEGGWCGLSAKFLREYGIPSFDFWPEHSRNTSYWNAACRANAALHKVTEEWVDLTVSVYDQNLTFDQVATCLLLNIPCALDFNWWGHSVMGCDLVEVGSGNFAIRIRNSWTNNWGDQGFSVIQGSRAIPNGAVALRVVGVSSSIGTAQGMIRPV